MSCAPTVPLGSGAPSGCPESMRDISGTGMFSSLLKVHGVWQSLQPPILVKYSPRFTCLLLLDDLEPLVEFCACAELANDKTANTHIHIFVSRKRCFISLQARGMRVRCQTLRLMSTEILCVRAGELQRSATLVNNGRRRRSY